MLRRINVEMGTTLFNNLQLGANNWNGKNLSINKMLNCLSPAINFKFFICFEGSLHAVLYRIGDSIPDTSSSKQS